MHAALDYLAFLQGFTGVLWGVGECWGCRSADLALVCVRFWQGGQGQPAWVVLGRADAPLSDGLDEGGEVGLA